MRYILLCRSMLSTTILSMARSALMRVDGFGNQLLMDDSNVPSLLGMGYMGDVPMNDPIYQEHPTFLYGVRTILASSVARLAKVSVVHTSVTTCLGTYVYHDEVLHRTER